MTARKQEKFRGRRDFGKALAAAALTPLAATAADKDPPKSTDPFVVAVEAQLDVIRARYGKNVTEEQLQEIKKSLFRGQYGAEVMKRFKLKNGDEPAFAFSPDLP